MNGAPRFVYYAAASLDGYIATHDDGLAWLPALEGGGTDFGYGEFYAGIDAIVMGRRTYDVIRALGPWPYGDRIVRVATSRPLPEPPAGAVASAAPPAALAEDLARAGARRAWLAGGGDLAASFREAGLLDEYVVTIVPVVLGGGVPLLAPRGPVEPLQLAATRTYPGGCVQLTYLRAGSEAP